MKQIIVVKPNSLSDEDKQHLKDNECIVIEHENPSEVRVIRSTEGFEGDDVLNCLIEALDPPSEAMARANFAKLLFTKLKNRKTT